MLGDIYCHLVEFDTVKLEEAWRWVREHNADVFPGNTYTRGKTVIRFKDANAAMMFKLVFAG